MLSERFCDDWCEVYLGEGIWWRVRRSRLRYTAGMKIRPITYRPEKRHD